jgi:hypothetical protein
VGGTKSNGILKGDQRFMKPAQMRRQKTNLKSRPHILRMIQQYSSEEYWNYPTKNSQLERTRLPQAQQ